MKVAVIQLRSGSDKRKNIEKAVSLAEKAAKRKAGFILLPEVFNFRGKNPGKEAAEPIPGESILPFIETAREKKVSILAGSVYEKTKGHKKVYNSSVFIDPRGTIKGIYRKRNLFKAYVDGKRIDETQIFLAGKKETIVNAGKFKVGLAICYDLRFPELFQQYRKNGCGVLAVPSSFTRKTGQAHWETLLRARAIENGCYVLAPNQTGKDGKGVASYGNSMIVGPWGKVLARASSHKEEIIYAEILTREINKAKKVLPSH